MGTDPTIRLRHECIARLRSRYLYVLPLSSEVTYASATFSCIGRYKVVSHSESSKNFCETFHIPDELSVIGAAKVSHFEIIYRVHGIEPTVGLSCCFYVNSKKKINAFACPALFLWHTGKSVSRDVIPKSSEFSEKHYATHVAYPAPFHKYPEPFLCLVGMIQMDLLSFIRTADPTKVKIGKRQRDEDEPKLLETTIGRVVPFLPVAPARSSSKLEASVDKLFDDGEWDDHGAPSGPIIGGKSQSSIKHLFAGAVQNAEVRGGVVPTLPFVTSFVSTTPEREGGDHTELLAGANLRTIRAPKRFVIFSDSSDHSGVNIAKAEVDSVVRTSVPIITSAATTTPTVDPAAIPKEKLVGSSVFGVDSPSTEGSHPIPGGFLIVLHEQLFTEFNVGAARQMSLSAELCMRAKYNIRERRRLNSIVEEKDALLKAKDEEIRSLKAQLVLKEAEAVKAVRLRIETFNFEAVEKSLQSEVVHLKERNNLLETEKSGLEVKVVDLAASVKVRE
nr:hypothetical protein [Tanacetum cinerariifolium]